jgi:phosphoribosylanthranilate isomerase
MGTDRPFLVKVCGITTLEDAQAAVDAGANALGFNFYPKSPRYISPENARSITDQLGRDVLKVGVFVNAGEKEMHAIANVAGLDVLQLHGSECEIPENTPYEIWRSIPGTNSVPEVDDRIALYLLDTPTPQFGGSGETFDWSGAANFPFPFVLAGGLDGTNVAEAIMTVRPIGVDACSRLEQRPGQKNADKVRQFVAAARGALKQQEVL